MSVVEDNHAEKRFQMPIEGSHEIGAVYYRISGARFILTHTIVPKKFSGRGVGSQLARGVFDEVRASGRKAILVCPFMTAFYAHHPEYADVVETLPGLRGPT